MEDQTTPNYPHEDVQKLQDKVRKLELQLSQQKSFNAKNGLITEVKRVVTYTDDSEISCDGIIEVYSDNTSIRAWLFAAPNLVENNDLCSEELLAWVRHNSDANPNQSFQLLRRKLYTDLCNAELEKRKNIDTRTFTRPKKRISRAPLEMMPEVLPTPNFQLTPPGSPQAPLFTPQLPNFPTKSVVGALLEDVDEQQILANMTCSLLESSLMGSMIVADNDADVVDVAPSDAVLPSTAAAIAAAVEVLTASTSSPTSTTNSTFQKVPSVPELREENEPNSSASEVVSRALSSSFERSHSGSLAALNHSDLTVVNCSAVFNKGSDPGLNMSVQNSSAPTSRGSSPANSTFTCSGRRGTITLGSRRGSSQMGSAESDDQLSVASDCSASSASRIMSVGDVQNLARLQEQSLLMVSTPKNVVSPKKPMLASDEKLSPIYGLLGRDSGSNRSESPALSSDTLSRSPVSSKHSSRSASPSGIRPPSESRVGNGLSNLIRKETFTASRDNINSNTFTKEAGAVNGINRESFSANINTATFVRMSRPAQAPSEAPRGLRPPSVRPRASGLPVLAQRPGTGIPRPASRIPPPRTSCPRPVTGPARFQRPSSASTASMASTASIASTASMASIAGAANLRLPLRGSGPGRFQRSTSASSAPSATAATNRLPVQGKLRSIGRLK